jgi:DMSO/TMAO reductase YedYZ molybdopterin-dependent catalytic subunit
MIAIPGAFGLHFLQVMALLAAVALPATRADDTPSVLLKIQGDVARPLELTAQKLAEFPRATVHVADRDGQEAMYEGVELVEVLAAAGKKFGQDLRGPELANYVLVEAADGYRALFALAELDPENTGRVVILADRRDGKPLDANEGPLRVVVPGEKRHARWVRQVTSLRVGKP